MSTSRLGLKGRLATIAAITTFLVLVGSGASWAYWTAQSTVNVSTTGADLKIDASGFASINKTFTNDSLTHTGSVVVTNTTTSTSAQKAQVTLAFTATGQTTAFRTGFGMVVWLSTATYPCTGAASGPALASGNWGTGASYVTASGDGFSVGETRTYCVRTTIANRGDVATPSGAATITPNIAGSIQVGNFTGSDADTASQSTSNIFTPVTVPTATTTYYWLRPNLSSTAYPTYCADVNGGTAGDGTTVISYGCKDEGAANQVWRFNSIPGRAGYYTIATGTDTNYLVDGAGGSLATRTASGTAVQVWHAQVINAASSTYQLVNDASGLCWVSPTGTAQNLGTITLAGCANVAAQRFTLSRVPTGITCTYNASTFTLGFTGAPSATYRLNYSGTTTQLGATATANATTGATTITFTRTNLGSNGTYDIELWDGYGTRVGSGTATRGGTFTLTGSCAISDMR